MKGSDKEMVQRVQVRLVVYRSQSVVGSHNGTGKISVQRMYMYYLRQVQKAWCIGQTQCNLDIGRAEF